MSLIIFAFIKKTTIIEVSAGDWSNCPWGQHFVFNRVFIVLCISSVLLVRKV